MIQSKRFVVLWLLTVLLVFAAVCAVVVLIDPYFHYHLPWFGLETVFFDERYQNPGLAKNAEYDSIIAGSSMSQNFDSKWFEDGFNTRAVNLSYKGATIENIQVAVEMAENEKNGNLKYVFCNMDVRTMQSPADEVFGDLPTYMYNDTLILPEYLLNAGILKKCQEVLESNREGTAQPLNLFQSWYEPEFFSQEGARCELDLPVTVEEVEQREPEITENNRAAVQKLTDLTKVYPDTVFYIFYSPYSLVAWYEYYYTEGDLLNNLDLLKYSMEKLLKCDNIRLFFPATYEMMTSFDEYRDATHYGRDISYRIYEEMRDGKNQLTEENYRDKMEEFRDMLLNCDFETAINGE